MKNEENPDEPETQSEDLFSKLTCHITNSTNYLMDGLKNGLEERMSKLSPSLNKECTYLKKSKISQLPYYLTIQFVRFFWRSDTKLKAKIVRPFEFPFVLDLNDFCTDQLKEILAPNRKLFREQEEKRVEEATRKQKEQSTQGKEEEFVVPSLQVPENVDIRNLQNKTGIYELFAIVTHKGRQADSGHYVGWVKQADDKWLKYDDDRVTVVNNEEIKKLSGKGGGDWHMAYICLFRSKNPE